MDGTPHLLTDVKFSERRKGYDPDEVDNFLERVSGAVAQLQDKLRQATARAEEADTKVADAKRAQAVAEAQVDKLKADVAKARTASVTAGATEPAVDAGASADAATNILVMAQKTAEGTVEEAKQVATTAIADARAKSATLVAEAERERDKLLAEAEVKAQALVDERASRVHAEAAELEHVRQELEADVEALRAYVDAHREALREGVHALAKVLDDPRSLRLPEPPDLSDATVAGFDPGTLEDAGETPVEEADENPVAEDEPTPEPDTQAPAEGVEPLAETDNATDSESDGATDSESDGATDSESDGATDVVTDSASPPPPATAVATDGPAVEPAADAAFPAPATDPEADFPPVEVPEILEPEGSAPGVFDAEKSDIDLTTERLFGASSAPPQESTDGGPPTELFAPFPAVAPRPEADSEFGVPDADADEAMRAFFEADFTEEPKEASRSRFGRKR